MQKGDFKELLDSKNVKSNSIGWKAGGGSQWASVGVAAGLGCGHIFESFQQPGRTPFHDSSRGSLILLQGRQCRDSLFDALELGQGYSLVIEDAVHVADELIDAEVNDSQVVQEPLLPQHCLLQLEQTGVHFLRPLCLLESSQLLGGLLLTVDGDDISHVLDGPDVHLHQSLITKGAAEEVGRAEAVDDIDTHGDGLSDDEGALTQVGQGGEGPLTNLFRGAEALPLGEREQLVLVVHTQVLTEQSADLRLPPEVVVADDNAMLQLAHFAL